MAKYFLTGKDRQTLQNTISIVNGGSGNNRPIARRRRGVVGGDSTGATWLLGRTVAAVTPSTLAFDVDSLVAFLGKVPTQEDSEEPVQTVSAENLFGWTLDEDALVLLLRGKTSDGEATRWICVQAECPD